MTKNEMIQSIISEMQAARHMAKAQHDAALYKAMLDPEFAKVYNDAAALSFALAKAESEQNNSPLLAKGWQPKADGVVNQLKSSYQKALALRDKLYTKHKIPTSVITCKMCNDTGRSEKNKICSCVTKLYTKKLAEQNGINSDTIKSFANLSDIFKDKTTKANYEKIYASLSKYCEKFPNVKIPNLVLVGGTGTGKTYAAEVIKNNLITRGFNVVYKTAFAIIETFKTYIRNFDNVEKDDIFTCDLLIIDDLGTEPNIKNITQEYLYNVINERLTQNKPFIMTTNLSPDDILKRYDQRLASRILSRETSVLIEMKSSDLRLKD